MATENMTRPPPFVATPLTPREAVFPGTVRAITGGGLAIAHEGGSSMARRAASCLLAPRPGDAVLCAEADGVLYVLAVLTRGTAGGEAEIDVEGDLTLRATGTARLSAKALVLAAEESTWIGRELRLLGEQLTLDATRIRQVSTFAERVAESVKETFGRSYRRVTKGEHLQAESLTISLRAMLRCHADTAVMTAKKLIKLDGDQIHLG